MTSITKVGFVNIPSLIQNIMIKFDILMLFGSLFVNNANLFVPHIIDLFTCASCRITLASELFARINLQAKKFVVKCTANSLYGFDKDAK